MRIAAIYDIHGNLPALEAVLDEIDKHGADEVVVGGDVVPGPMPRECLHALDALEVPVHFVRGNGEREVLAVRNGASAGEGVPESLHRVLRWVAEELTDDDARALARWSSTLTLAVPGIGDVLFCHATPLSDKEIFTPVTPEERLLHHFEKCPADVVVCGHTHLQFQRRVGGVQVVNAGSVGMVFGEPGADWLLIGPGVDPRHTSYDRERAAERITATAYPGAADFAEANVLHPPSAAEMIELFERSSVGPASRAR